MNLTWVTISVSCFCVFVEFVTCLLLVESMRSFLLSALAVFLDLFGHVTDSLRITDSFHYTREEYAVTNGI